MRRFTILTVAASAIIGLAASSRVASAATAAYWRHEEGPVGSIIPDGPNTVLDASGNGNHMQTFGAAFAPFTAATYVSAVSPLPLRSGLPNALALDFGPLPVEGTEDGADPGSGNGRNDDNYSAEKPINNQLFPEITVELAFNMHEVGPGLYQTLFGKDGKPLGDMVPPEDDSPLAPFAVKVRGDGFPGDIPNQLQVEWIDGDGTLNSDTHFLASGFSIIPNQWYHVAFTLNAADAHLWVAEEGGAYVEVDSKTGQDYAGSDGRVIVLDPTPFTIGRGMFGNGVTDWSNAIIDEVRVSNEILAADEFLFLASAPATDADFDNDNDVDGQDFLIWQRGNGAAGGNGAGDANSDGQVNGADLGIWKGKFGGAPIGAVPEPASAALLAVACWGLRKRRS